MGVTFNVFVIVKKYVHNFKSKAYIVLYDIIGIPLKDVHSSCLVALCC